MPFFVAVGNSIYICDINDKVTTKRTLESLNIKYVNIHISVWKYTRTCTFARVRVRVYDLCARVCTRAYD